MPKEPPRPVEFLRRVLPTTKHAWALFQMVVDRLDRRAVVLTSGGKKSRVLYVRGGGDVPFIVPWPLLRLVIADPPPEGPPPEDDRVITFEELEAADDWEPWRGGKPVSLEFRLVPATLTLYDGELTLQVNYRWNGRWKDCVQPAEQDAFESLVAALERPSDNRLELLAEYVAEMDIGRHGTARVIVPRPTPGGIEGAWGVVRAAVRQAMAARRVPPGSFWAVGDGYVGSALAFGTSRDDTLAAWRKEVERLHPKPPPPRKPSDLSPPEGAMMITGRGYDAPEFDPSLEAVPAAAVRVAALPAAKPPHGTWTRWLGDLGATKFAVRLPIEGGYTMVGESLLSLIDLATIDETLDAIDQAHWEMLRGADLPTGPESTPLTHATVYYRCIDAATGLPIEPRIEQSNFGREFDTAGFDGNRLRTHVVRVRALE